LACVVLLASGAANAQKNKKSHDLADPFANTPALPAPKLLSREAPSTELSAVANAPSEALSRPATDSAHVPAMDAGSEASTPAVMADSAPLAPASTPAPGEAPVSTYAPSTGRTHSILTFDEYEHLLNLVMPYDHRSPPGLEYSLILRFEPHVHPESQIVIRRWRDGRIETELYRVDKVNAWRAAYGNVTEGQTPDFVAMTHLIKIVRNSINVKPSEEAAWRRELLPTLQKELAEVRKRDKQRKHDDEHVLAANGTRYELWYIQNDNEMHFVSYDNEVDSVTKGTQDLTRLMNKVRSYADSHLTDYKPLHDNAAAQTQLAKNKKK
jgi:hypothetical protein